MNVSSYSLSKLFIYPVKSMRGIALDAADLDSFGLEHDRRWMLIDEHNKFLTQRQLATMCLINISLTEQGLLAAADGAGECQIALADFSANTIAVQVWKDTCSARVAPNPVNQWFSDFLKTDTRLVYMGADEVRPVNPDYARSDNDRTSFADGFPLLIIGQASLDDLNTKLADKNQPTVPIERFRPNIVISTTTAFEEDNWDSIKIGTLEFSVVKPCQRCIIPTIDIQTASKAKEPLTTLREYRQQNMKIYFGQNAIHHSSGRIALGDAVVIK